MRGRTLDDSFIILDEAQNTSREQMKMFLTRLGFGSKIVITGDITQIDLPADKAPHISQRRHLDVAPLQILLIGLRAQHFKQGVVQRAQIGVYLRLCTPSEPLKT